MLKFNKLFLFALSSFSRRSCKCLSTDISEMLSKFFLQFPTVAVAGFSLLLVSVSIIVVSTSIISIPKICGGFAKRIDKCGPAFVEVITVSH